MSLKKVSIRLGMNYGLYIGICIGFMVAALIILSILLIFSLGLTHVVATSLALFIGSLVVIGIILHAQHNLVSVVDQVCICRYRSGIHTLCIQCALYPECDQTQDKSVDVVNE